MDNNDKFWVFSILFFMVSVIVIGALVIGQLNAIEKQLNWQSANWNNEVVNYTPWPESK